MSIGPKSRTERPRKTKIGTDVANVTRDSDTTFKVRGHQAALFSAALMRKVAATVSVGTYSAWERMLRCVCSAAREAFGCPWGRRGNVM